MPLPGLANCSAFLEQNFVNPIKLQLRQMEGMVLKLTSMKVIHLSCLLYLSWHIP